MPKEGEIRNLWIQKISEHQSINSNSVYFQVCERHFKDNDFIRKGGKLVLRKESVPSIFNESPKESRSEFALVAQNAIYKKTLGVRYCKIKCCPNEVGTNDKEISFFR